MTERTDRLATSRRKLLGVVGGTVVGIPSLARRSTGGTDATGGRQDETETPTPTPSPPDPVWTLFQYDRTNSGHWPDGRGPVSEPGVRWSHLDGGSYPTTPVITESEVFVADRADGVVRAIDRTSGTERWRQSVDVASARMTIQDRTLYVPTRKSSAQLRALDAEDGSAKWKVNLGSAANSVVTSGNSVFATSAGGIYKVSTLSDTIDWHYDGVTLVETSIALTDSAVYTADTVNGKVEKLGISTGGRSWSNNLDGAAVDAPTVADNHVLVPFDEYLVALKEESGRELWRYEAPVAGSVAVADGVVYGTTTGGEAFALDYGNGQEQWRTGGVAAGNSPVLVGGLLYLAGSDGALDALNPGTGSTAWSTDVGAEVTANPAVAGGELYLADRAGRVGALTSGASGGYGEDTPTPTETRTATSSPTPTATPTDAGGSGNAGNSGGSGSSGSSDADTPEPSTPRVGTSTPSDEGGIDLPIVGGAIASVLALLGGGLWWRSQQQDEYDPLG